MCNDRMQIFSSNGWQSHPRIPEFRGRARFAILPATSAGNSITRWKDAHGLQCSLNLSNGNYVLRGGIRFVCSRAPALPRRSSRARVRRECIIIKSRSRSADRARANGMEGGRKKGGTCRERESTGGALYSDKMILSIVNAPVRRRQAYEPSDLYPIARRSFFCRCNKIVLKKTKVDVRGGSEREKGQCPVKFYNSIAERKGDE